MSLKNSQASGDNWHLYEEFGENEGVFIRVDSTTLFLKHLKAHPELVDWLPSTRPSDTCSR